MFILGILVFLAGIFYTAMCGASYDITVVTRALIDYPTTLFFIIVIIAVILATGSFKVFMAAVKALFSKKYNISTEDAEIAVRLLKLLGKSVMYAAVLQAVMGLILILNEVNDLTYLGPKVSLALSAVFQGTCINLVLIYPAVGVLQARCRIEEKKLPEGN